MAGARARRLAHPVSARPAVRPHGPPQGAGRRRRRRRRRRASSSSSSSRARRWWSSASSSLFGAMIYPMYALTVAHANDFAAPDEFVKIAGGLLLLLGCRHHGRPDRRRAGDGAHRARKGCSPSPPLVHLAPRALHPLPHVAAQPPAAEQGREAFQGLPLPKTATPESATLDPRRLPRPTGDPGPPEPSPDRPGDCLRPVVLWQSGLLSHSRHKRSRSRTGLPRPRKRRNRGHVADGVFRSAAHQWADARLDLRADRDRLHDGLRDHRHDQLRPWRHLHGRRVPRADRPDPASA